MPRKLPRQAELPLWAADEPLPPAGGEARRLVLGDQVVPYVLRRSRRRTIGLTIDGAGLRVGAPNRASREEVETLIRRHGNWVLDKLRQWTGRSSRPSVQVVDGVAVPLLGGYARLSIVPGGNRFRWDGDVLHVFPRPPTTAAGLLERALRERARQLFSARVAHHAAILQLPPPPIALSSARTRWGSCNRETGIRLNWRLIHFALPLIDYVVVHELAHLRQMNHSPRFWAIVEGVLPDYRALRTELAERAEHLPEFR